MMTSVLEPDGICEDFDVPIVHVAASVPVAQLIFESVVIKQRIMASEARYVANRAMKKVSEAAQQLA